MEKNERVNVAQARTIPKPVLPSSEADYAPMSHMFHLIVKLDCACAGP
jgi:hypothetical protein